VPGLHLSIRCGAKRIPLIETLSENIDVFVSRTRNSGMPCRFAIVRQSAENFIRNHLHNPAGQIRGATAPMFFGARIRIAGKLLNR